MEKITITASKTYDVLTGSGLLPRAGAYIRQALGEKVRKICVVTDSNVAPLYSDALISSVRNSGLSRNNSVHISSFSLATLVRSL